MAAVSLSWNTDMTAVTSCEKALQVKKESNPYKVFKIFAKHKFDTRDQSVCKRRVKVFQFSSGNHQDPYCSSVFFKLYTSQQTSPTPRSFRTESFPSMDLLVLSLLPVLKLCFLSSSSYCSLWGKTVTIIQNYIATAMYQICFSILKLHVYKSSAWEIKAEMKFLRSLESNLIIGDRAVDP